MAMATATSRSYYDVTEVMEMLGCKQDKAYKVKGKNSEPRICEENR